MSDDHYDILLMDYACGGLDDGLALLVASHLSLSREAQAHMAVLENLGGALLQECCGQVAMDANALATVLALLETPAPAMPSPQPRDFGCRLPAPLKQHLCGCTSHQWQADRQGVSLMPVTLPNSGRRALLIRALPGTIFTLTPAPRRYVLVLEGAIAGGDAGELLIFEGSGPVRLHADPETGCVCLVVHEKPTLAGWLRSLLSF